MRKQPLSLSFSRCVFSVRSSAHLPAGWHQSEVCRKEMHISPHEDKQLKSRRVKKKNSRMEARTKNREREREGGGVGKRCVFPSCFTTTTLFWAIIISFVVLKIRESERKKARARGSVSTPSSAPVFLLLCSRLSPSQAHAVGPTVCTSLFLSASQ